MLRNLYEGLQGNDVKAVQEALELQSISIVLNGQKVPLTSHPLVPKGIFGPKTRAAVIEFQKSKHLKPDGIVGPLTRAALYPYGVGRLTVLVSKNLNSVSAPKSAQVAPASHPALPVTLGKFPGLSTHLGVPLVPAPTLPPPVSPSGSSQTSQSVQIKAGEQVSIPLKQFPTPSSKSSPSTTLAIDWVGMIFTPKRVDLGPISGPSTIGIDLGLGIPTSSNAKFTASASWAVTLAPEMFKFDRFDLLALSAKAGVGLVGQNSNPSSFLSASNSLALTMSYDIIPSQQKGDPALLKLFLQGAFNASLDHRDSKFHLTTTLPATLGIVGNF